MPASETSLQSLCLTITTIIFGCVRLSALVYNRTLAVGATFSKLRRERKHLIDL